MRLNNYLSVFLLFPCLVCTAASPAPTGVVTLRTPNEGIAPQAATSPDGTVHLVYFKRTKGDHGDLYYVRSRDGGETFSTPLRVNSRPDSAMSARHPRLALGRNGRAHVVWNATAPAADSGNSGMPLAYARLNDDGTAFEPQRNLMRNSRVLDGGGTIAADGEGNVYALWHALPANSQPGEQNRRLFVARSIDDGKTFGDELVAWDQPVGACGCCYVGAYTDTDSIYVLYRAAETASQRDMYLLTSTDHGKTFTGAKVDGWPTSACPMSTAAITRTNNGIVGGWETRGRVVFGSLATNAVTPIARVPAAQGGNTLKYPTIAANGRGESIHVWTEGMAWKRGGAALWQVYDASGKPLGEPGRAQGVPPDGEVASFARPDGTFVIVY